MSPTLCTSGAVKLKAGKAVSDDLTDDDYNQLIEEAESYINDALRINIVDKYSDLKDNIKKILQDAASNFAACSAVAYDMSGYTARATAQTVLNVCWAKWQDSIELLKDKKTTSFMVDQ